MALFKGLLVAAIISLSSARLSEFLGGAQWAKDNEHPFHVAITPKSPHNNRTIFCSGAIIAPNWVLTTAVCALQSEEHEIRFGSVNHYTGGGVVTSNKTHVLPTYNPTLESDSVALIYAPGLGGEAINLVPANSNVSERFSMVTGWGRLHNQPSPILQYVFGTIIDENKFSVCRHNFGNTLEDGRLCARFTGQPGCAGDSGSPLIVSENNTNYLAGVAIFNTDYIGCFSSVSIFASFTAEIRGWIAELTGIKS